MASQIESISNQIQSLFNTDRAAFPTISPPQMIWMGVPEKPGLNTTVSVANIAKTLDEYGIPTSTAQDGTVNFTLALVIAIVDEVYRALHEDANTQVSIPPYTSLVETDGANEGGPLHGVGTNTKSIEGSAQIC